MKEEILISANKTVYDYEAEEREDLKTSKNLQFLQVGKEKEKKIGNIFEREYWSLYENGKALSPLKFSNGKTQEDVVKELVDLIQKGNKVIFLHGICGTGKSAIALNVARKLGKTSIVVPFKSLQRQYEEDYTSKKYLIKSDGERMRIAVMTGRDNHDSIIKPGISCADPELPDTIKITEKNFNKIKEYYEQNPFIKSKNLNSLKHIRRISIAPANPYWSPILPGEYDLKHLTDATRIEYSGMRGRKFIFYHRKEGCSYYDQYLAYVDSDLIIFNSAKYLIELDIGRKPETEVEIIDEADEFLDGLSAQVELNLDRLSASLKMIEPEAISANETKKEIIKLIELEKKNKRVLGIDENEVFHLNDTKLGKILCLFLKDPELESEILLDELNYSNKALEAARALRESFSDLYLTYRKHEEALHVKLVSTNLSKKVEEIVNCNKAVIFMSGTLHSDSVIKNIFGIKEYKVVNAETKNPGIIEIHRTGKEFDCKYSNLKNGNNSRERYLYALNDSVGMAEKPVLVHVNAFEDLPNIDELSILDLPHLISREHLKDLQRNDKNESLVSLFKSGMNDVLFTTKCSRGADFPGEMCKSVVLTKYPNPNVQDTFWKVLRRTHPYAFWDFYKDKAWRGFFQRISRAVRFSKDHVYVLSPDLRVLEAVKEMQKTSISMGQN